MEKKQYEKPMTEVIQLPQQTELLAGSGVSATISDFVEEEWIPNPTAPEMDLTDMILTDILDDSSI